MEIHSNGRGPLRPGLIDPGQEGIIQVAVKEGPRPEMKGEILPESIILLEWGKFINIAFCPYYAEPILLPIT